MNGEIVEIWKTHFNQAQIHFWPKYYLTINQIDQRFNKELRNCGDLNFFIAFNNQAQIHVH